MRIQALASLIHDGASHPPGDTLTVPDGAGAILIRRGLAREIPASVANEPVVSEPVATSEPVDTTPVATSDETTTSRRTKRVRRSPQTREGEDT